MKIKVVLIIAFIALCFSCTKDKIETDTVNKFDESKGILIFKNFDDYSSTLEKVLSMRHNERIAWEKQMNFSSLGLRCDKVYFSIDPNNFSSIDEIKTYVENNKEYLVLVQDEIGDYTLETSYYTNSNRYLFNQDKMFQIGKLVYKELKEGLVVAPEEELDFLKGINSIDLLGKKSDVIKLINQENTFSYTAKDAQNNCGNDEKVKRADNGNLRTKMSFSLNYIHADENGVPVTYINNLFEVRPYVKILFIWYWTERKVSYHFKIAIDKLGSSGWERTYHYWYEPGTWTWQEEKILMGGRISYGWVHVEQHFAGYDCWAKIPETPKAELKCNEQVLPPY